MSKTSPTSRSLKYLRDQGSTLVQVTEKWNPFAKIRQDLFGFVDILCVNDNTTIGVQTTSYSNMSARKKKILESPNFNILKAAGWEIHIHGWKKNVKTNKWELKEIKL